jgi:hypothetical protein
MANLTARRPLSSDLPHRSRIPTGNPAAFLGNDGRTGNDRVNVDVICGSEK